MNKECRPKHHIFIIIAWGYNFEVYQCTQCKKYVKKGMLYLQTQTMKPLTKPLLQPIFKHQPKDYDARENMTIIINPIDFHKAISTLSLNLLSATR